MTLWPAIQNIEQVLAVIEVRGQRRAIMTSSSSCEKRTDFSDLAAIEMGMKTADTQTELIDESGNHPNTPLGFKMISEGHAVAVSSSSSSSNNNNDKRLNINSLKDMRDLQCIDDDSASGHRILFNAPDNPETKL